MDDSEASPPDSGGNLPAKAAAGAEPHCGKLLSHRESIALIDSLGRNFIPELKPPVAPLPSSGTFTQENYAQMMIDDYKAAGIDPIRVFPQSSSVKDILYWLSHEPLFGQNAVFLDEELDAAGGYDAAVAHLPELSREGVRIVAPPLWALVTLDASGHIVPSTYAKVARESNLELMTWTLERSGSLNSGGGYSYKSVAPAISGDGDLYVMLDVLARQVGVRGVFSDWPATVTYYANCLGL
jgi:glycerophosphoryl diester phosphodiesterase